jgi:hypothetical protein
MYRRETAVGIAGKMNGAGRSIQKCRYETVCAVLFADPSGSLEVLVLGGEDPGRQ